MFLYYEVIKKKEERTKNKEERKLNFTFVNNSNKLYYKIYI